MGLHDRRRTKWGGPAILAAGLLLPTVLAATAGASEGAPAAGDKKPAPAKDAKDAPAAKGTDKAPVPPGGGAAGTVKTSPPPPVAPQGPGMYASIDDFFRRAGRNLEESKVLGMRLRLHGTEEIAWSDNIFYQDRGEQFVVDLDPSPSTDGIDADPDLEQPRGRVNSFVNNFTLGGELEMALNANLIPLLGEGENTIKVFGAGIQSVHYLSAKDGPDALNWNMHLDFPIFLNTMLRGLLPQGGKNSFYFRTEADYQKTTDPLDVARYEYSSVNPTLAQSGERNDFTREEWYGKATLGWKGPRFDSKVSYRYYSFSVDDITLDSADHIEQEFYAEIGWRPPASEHRFYGFGEWTLYDFDQRGIGNDVELLRNYHLLRTGPGWEGPLFSKKIRSRAEVYWLAQTIDDNRRGPLPRGDDTKLRPYDQYHGMGGMTRTAYRPFTTKSTQLEFEYRRELQWSVVADNKVVDIFSLTFTHPVNEKLTAEMLYNVTFENVSHGEKRTYHEAGVGVRYKLWAYTEAHLRYTFRFQDTNKERAILYADSSNQPFAVQSSQDFFANIISLGIDVNF